MKITKLVIALAITATSGAAIAQNSSTVTGVKADTRMIVPITIVKVADLEFGNIIAPTSGTATEIIHQAFPTSYSNAGTKPGSQVGTVNSSQFTVSGEPGFTVNLVSTPAFGSNMTITDGGSGATHTMTVTLSFPTDVTGITLLSNPVADATGTLPFWVGGKLTISSVNVPGNYSNNNAGGTAWSINAAY